MIKMNDILDEKDKRLRLVSKDATFPLSKKDLKAIDDMITYLTNSQIEDIAEKEGLRPGMGMAAIQLGINKRYFVVVYEVTKEDDIEQKFETYILVNPKMVSHSEEIICAETGEGCLSVNRETDGYVKRYARVTMSGFDINGSAITIRAREELAIAFQHELDHLNGILFIDKLTNDIEGIRTI
ncbi:peptide deformylase [Clostridium sp. CAG:1193]|nr:peptide deformylase [Clostridium sp. CAG:1193]